MPPLRRHELDPHNVFAEGFYFENGNDACITIHPELAHRPRLTLTVREAYQQGIISEHGVDPRWLVVIPVMSIPGFHHAVTKVYPRKDGTFYICNTQPNCDPIFRHVFPPIVLHPNARLHIIVNC